MDRGNCRGCGAAINWVVMESGKRCPIDPEPDAERGNIQLPGEDETRARTYGPLQAAAERSKGTPLYLSHFATCPQRQAFRKR